MMPHIVTLPLVKLRNLNFSNTGDWTGTLDIFEADKASANAC